jgi:hypothetical protein
MCKNVVVGDNGIVTVSFVVGVAITAGALCGVRGENWEPTTGQRFFLRHLFTGEGWGSPAIWLVSRSPLRFWVY